MFKEILQSSLFVALVLAKNPSEQSCKYGGLCILDFEEVVHWCTVGTPVGEKVMGALSTCSSRGLKNCNKGKEEGKGKDLFASGEKCPSVDEVEAWFMEEYPGKTV